MSQTTTILYTDIVGSSDVLAAVGDEQWRALFGAHVASTRTIVAGQDGQVVKLLGDGVLATFASAHAGVRAAIEIQQAVDLANRRDAPELLLRTGLSVGEVVEDDDDLFGSALVVGRRVCDAAEAGQILVTDVVRALVAGRRDLVLDPIGEMVLDGVAEPVAVSAVRWDPLPPVAPMEVVVADDATLIRSGVVRLLSEAGFLVTADVGDAEALLAAVDARPPRLVVTDIRMPPDHSDEGLVAAAAIRDRHPDVAVLVLSQHVETGAAADLLDGRPAGIGYLLKERVSDLDEFVDACHRVAAGASVIDPTVASRLLRRRADDRALASLSGREREVLSLMAEGRSNQAIADELHVGAKTVETYVRGIFQKLDIEESATGNRRVRAVLRWLHAG